MWNTQKLIFILFLACVLGSSPNVVGSIYKGAQKKAPIRYTPVANPTSESIEMQWPLRPHPRDVRDEEAYDYRDFQTSRRKEAGKICGMHKAVFAALCISVILLIGAVCSGVTYYYVIHKNAIGDFPLGTTVSDADATFTSFQRYNKTAATTTVASWQSEDFAGKIKFPGFKNFQGTRAEGWYGNFSALSTKNIEKDIIGRLHREFNSMHKMILNIKTDVTLGKSVRSDHSILMFLYPCGELGIPESAKWYFDLFRDDDNVYENFEKRFDAIGNIFYNYNYDDVDTFHTIYERMVWKDFRFLTEMFAKIDFLFLYQRNITIEILWYLKQNLEKLSPRADMDKAAKFLTDMFVDALVRLTVNGNVLMYKTEGLECCISNNIFHPLPPSDSTSELQLCSDKIAKFIQDTFDHQDLRTFTHCDEDMFHNEMELRQIWYDMSNFAQAVSQAFDGELSCLFHLKP